MEMKGLEIDRVRRRLRLVTGLESHIDPLDAVMKAVRDWNRPVPLGEWSRAPGSYSVAHHGENRFWIKEVEPPELEYEWPDRGRRTLRAGGTREELVEHAELVAGQGGPRGGPSRGTREGRPVALTRWDTSSQADDALIGSVGRGYEFRIRPVGRKRDGFVLVLVSPLGSVAVLTHGGSHDLASSAVYAYEDLRPWDEVLPAEYYPPLTVSLRGAASNLLYTPIRGALGYARVKEIEAFLLLLGVEDFALITSVAGGEPKCIQRWSLPSERSWELSPPPPINLKFERPAFPHADAVSDSIASMNRLAEPVIEHFCKLVDEAQKHKGSRGVRGILWLIAAKHQLGQRSQKFGGRDEVIDWLYDGAQFSAPRDRSRREALTWLLPRTPFLEHVPLEGQMRWIIRFDWLKRPPPRILRQLA